MAAENDNDSSLVDREEHLFLHFDINETIWIGDEAGGDTFDQCLHKILAKSAFVRYNLEDSERPLTQEQRKRAAKVVPTHWWDGTPIDQPHGPPLWTRWEWPPNALPYYRTAYKQRADTFVEHHGRIYRPIYESMRDLFQSSTMNHAIPSQMLPSFVVTLRELSQLAQTIPSLHITVILRTFGTDLARITDSLACLAQQEGHAEWICPPQNVVQGRWKRDTQQQYEYQLIQSETVVAAGDAAVLEWLYALQPRDGKGRLVMAAIQDDYDHWSSHRCIPQAGKPIWKTRNSRYHHVLFDDNIHNLEHNSIACVREEVTPNTFRTLSGRETLQQQDIHLIRVPTVDAVLQENWFIDQIHAARSKQKRMGFGLPDTKSSMSLRRYQ